MPVTAEQTLPHPRFALTQELYTLYTLKHMCMLSDTQSKGLTLLLRLIC